MTKTQKWSKRPCKNQWCLSKELNLQTIFRSSPVTANNSDFLDLCNYDYTVYTHELKAEVTVLINYR